MKILFIVLCAIISGHSFACMNTIPHSEAVKAIAQEPNAGSKSCSELSEEACYCYDGIVFEAAEIVDETDDIGIYTGKKILQNNPTKKAAYDAARLAEAQYLAADAYAKKAVDCGQSTKRLMLIRNQPKNLTTTQVKQLVSTYAPISQLLDSGSLESSKEEISAVVADGVLVTEADKTALINHINGCKP